MKNVFGISVFICSGSVSLSQTLAVRDRRYRTVAASLRDASRGPQGRDYNYTFTFFQTPFSSFQL